MSTDTLIESSVDKQAAGSLAIDANAGGLSFGQMGEAMEFAKLMAVGGVAVPAHLRKNPGACLAVTIQAIEWRMSPFAVANKTYVVNDRLCFESQLVHAVIEQRAPLVGRLRHRFNGSGDARTCTVWASIKGEESPLEYTSPEIGKITPKNSPLWKTKPDLQLYYNASRDWARMYFPDVIMGVYSVDELEDSRPVVATVTTRPRTMADLMPKADATPEPTHYETFLRRLGAATTEAEAKGIYEEMAHPDGPATEFEASMMDRDLRNKLEQLKGGAE